MAEDRLQEIPPAEWMEWRDLYKADWPRHEVAYNLVQNYISWREEGVSLAGMVAYSLNGAWASDGTYVVVDGGEMFMYTLDGTWDTLRRTLILIDWRQSYLINMGLYRPLVLDIYEMFNQSILFDKHTFIYYMTHEKARRLDVRLPAGMHLAPLKPSDANFINDEWPHKRPGSVHFIEQLIQTNVNVGLFDEHDQLLGWCMRVQNGAMAMLGVAKPRQGYGSLVALGFAHKMGQMGLNTYASVIEENEAPRRMFEKLGFKLAWTTDWMRNGPRKVGQETTPN